MYRLVLLYLILSTQNYYNVITSIEFSRYEIIQYSLLLIIRVFEPILNIKFYMYEYSSLLEYN